MTPRVPAPLGTYPGVAPVSKPRASLQNAQLVAIDAERDSQFSKLAYWCLVIFVFLTTSRVLDVVRSNLHLPLILSVFAAGFTFLSGNLLRVFKTQSGRLMGLYGAWFLVCMPFSEWKGGSFEVLTTDLIKSFLLFVVVGGVADSVRRLRGILLAIAVGMIAAMVIALAMNARVDGRLMMKVGQLANSNDLAQMLVLGMCLLPVIGTGDKNRPILKGMAYLMMVPFLYATLQTGSRGVFVSLAALFVIVFVVASGARKVLMIGFGVVGVALFATSETAKVRVATIVSDDVAKDGITRAEDNALSSTAARVETLKQSLELTLKNPLFGVGPGVFQSAAADERHEDGKRALWVETHNSYTQVSSETGIPGIILFGGAIGTALLGLYRIRKYAERNPDPKLAGFSELATYLLLGFLSFAFTSAFSSVAYKSTTWMLVALCGACISLVRGGQQTVPSAAPIKAAAEEPTVHAVPLSTPALNQTRTERRGNFRFVMGGMRPVRPSSPAPGQKPRLRG